MYKDDLISVLCVILHNNTMRRTQLSPRTLSHPVLELMTNQEEEGAPPLPSGKTANQVNTRHDFSLWRCVKAVLRQGWASHTCCFLGSQAARITPDSEAQPESWAHSQRPVKSAPKLWNSCKASRCFLSSASLTKGWQSQSLEANKIGGAQHHALKHLPNMHTPLCVAKTLGLFKSRCPVYLRFSPPSEHSCRSLSGREETKAFR